MQKLLACLKKTHEKKASEREEIGGEVEKQRECEGGGGKCAVHLAEQREEKLQTEDFSALDVCQLFAGTPVDICVVP